MSEDRPDSVICRYRWTEEEAWKASSSHMRKAFRRPFRWLFYSILILLLAASIWSLATKGFEVSSVLFLLGSSYFLFFRRFEARFWHRRRFRLRPDRDAMVEFRFSDAGISTATEGLGSGHTAWAGIFKVLEAPEGFLLYPNEGIMHWLPRHGFSPTEAVGEFDLLVRAKVSQYSKIQ